MRRASLAAVGAALLVPIVLGGCASAPEPDELGVETPEAWWEAGSQPPLALEAAWWSALGEPELDQLVERALASNLDVRLARARLREARALREAGGALTRPELDLVAGYARSSASENGPLSQPPGESDLWTAGLDARWELDFFGRRSGEVEALQAGLEAAQEDLRATLVSLLGELARVYVELRGAQRQIAVARSNAEALEDTLGLTRSRSVAGLATELDVARVETELAATRAEIPRLEADVRSGLHQLAVLTGVAPGASVEALAAEAPLPLFPAQIGAGTPGELVRRRPDIRRAERELARTRALTGVAEAELYPRITLFGSLALTAENAGDLAQGDSLAWSAGPALVLPLFDRSALRAQARAAGERAEQALIVWERSVLVAFAEVEDALSGLARERERAARLSEALAAADSGLELARSLNAGGIVDFFQVLDARRARFLAESALARSQTEIALRGVALYKALGGGWELAETKLAAE